MRRPRFSIRVAMLLARDAMPPVIPSGPRWTDCTPTSDSGGGCVCHPSATGIGSPGTLRYQKYAPSGPRKKGAYPGA